MTRPGRARNAAFYNAIEAQKDTDALVAPRWEVETTNYILFKSIKAKVKGKAIRYNVTTGPAPAAPPAGVPAK